MKNLPASVRERLLQRARAENRPFNELLQYYAMERFLYRLSQSLYVHQFILKGALMLRVWHSPELRPTMDIDMLGKNNNQPAAIAAQISKILTIDAEPDGLLFDIASINCEQITEEADYTGVRVRFQAFLNTAKIRLQIDIGFGDIIHPHAERASFPTLLDFPAPDLLCYSRESVIAEKFEAMVKLGILNSRMKDFYDIWLLSRHFRFDEEQLAQAIHLTFDRRGTSLPTHIEAFEENFIYAKQSQWTAFRKRLRLEDTPTSFQETVSAIEAFFSLILIRLM